MSSFFKSIHRLTVRRAARLRWIRSESEAALLNLSSGFVLAEIWHDGCGKYHPTLFVSPRRALRLIATECAAPLSVLCFPRLSVELYRFKADCMDEVIEAVDQEYRYLWE